VSLQYFSNSVTLISTFCSTVHKKLKLFESYWPWLVIKCHQ